MRSIAVQHRSHEQDFAFTNRRGEVVSVGAAPGRPSAWPAPWGVDTVVVGSALGSGTQLGYLSRAEHEGGVRLVILTVLSDSGEQVGGPVLSEQLDEEEAGSILRSAAGADDPVRALRRFVAFHPDREVLAARVQ